MTRLSSGSSVIVLGGGGFIGTNLCRRLAASGVRVRAFGRQCHFPDELAGAEWYQGDFADAAALAAAMQGFETVVHLVNNTTPQGANLDMAGDVQKNVVPSLALFDLCRDLGIGRLVFVSSGGTVYGVPRHIPTPETASTDPITAYAISKLAVEKYLAPLPASPRPELPCLARRQSVRTIPDRDQEPGHHRGAHFARPAR